MARKIKSFDYNATFPRRLRALLDADPDATQERLAALTGVTRQTVGNWCSGKSAPDAVALSQIAGAFDVSIDWLLRENAPRAADAHLGAVCRYVGLSEQAVQRLHELQENIRRAMVQEEYPSAVTGYRRDLVCVAQAMQQIMSDFIAAGAMEDMAEALARHNRAAEKYRTFLAANTMERLEEIGGKAIYEELDEANQTYHKLNEEFYLTKYEVRAAVEEFISTQLKAAEERCAEGREASIFFGPFGMNTDTVHNQLVKLNKARSLANLPTRRDPHGQHSETDE